MIETTHNPFGEIHRASCLRENLTSSSYGEGLETDRASAKAPPQSFTRQLFFKCVKQNLRIKRFYDTSEKCGQKPNLDRHRRLRVESDHQEGAGFEGLAAYFAADSVRHLVRENIAAKSACRPKGRPNDHHLA
jgi:hypothetical protein